MIPVSRSQNASLIEGATDGKYRKRRPDTEVQPGLGDHLVRRERAGLHPGWNYGFVNSEAPAKAEPTGR